MKMNYDTSVAAAPIEISPAKEVTLETSVLETIVLKIGKKRAQGNDSETGFRQLVTENYLAARTQLNRLVENNQLLPDLIVIDQPYVKREVNNFIEWLNKSAEFCQVPVVYNRTYLNSFEVKEIRSRRLVDDIVDVDKNAALLPAKAQFLKRLKSHQGVPKVLAAQPLVNLPRKWKRKEICRRFLDILISFSLILLLLPVLLIIAIAVRLESRGPIIYISKRAGMGYRIFNFYKFRTMYVGADNQREELEKLNLYSIRNSSARFFKIKNDPRITKIGAFLRNTSLDELPQLFNVLKGDMSIVGNRPLPLYEAATLTTDDWAERFMAPAGITGLWQIEKRGREEMSVEERINLDISYAKNNDLLKDLWIIAKTPTALFQKTNV